MGSMQCKGILYISSFFVYFITFLPAFFSRLFSRRRTSARYQGISISFGHFPHTARISDTNSCRILFSAANRSASDFHTPAPPSTHKNDGPGGPSGRISLYHITTPFPIKQGSKREMFARILPWWERQGLNLHSLMLYRGWPVTPEYILAIYFIFLWPGLRPANFSLHRHRGPSGPCFSLRILPLGP